LQKEQKEFLMKKFLTLMMVLGLASMANAGVIDLVTVGVGSNGHSGTIGDPLDISETIELAIVLNHNLYGGYPSYDGYMLSSMDLDLHVVGAGSLAAGTFDKNGDPVWQNNPGLSPFVVNDDGDVSNGLDQITGVSLAGLLGAAVLLGDLFFHAEGGNSVLLDLTLNGLSEYSPFHNLSGAPYPGGWEQLTEGDLGNLVIHQVIPEPMTMSLLALGGLGLIRRRRRA